LNYVKKRKNQSADPGLKRRNWDMAPDITMVKNANKLNPDRKIEFFHGAILQGIFWNVKGR
jgi:hypothetical protein